jgi:hypothetical protein
MHFRQAESAAAAAASEIAELKRLVKPAEENAGEGARADTAGLNLEGLALGVGLRVLGFRVSWFGIKKAARENATGVSADTSIPKPETRNPAPFNQSPKPKSRNR